MSGSIMRRKKTGNVVGRQVVERFESMNKSTELDTLVNRQPVKLLQKRGSMSASGFLKYKPCTSVLNSLEAGDVLLEVAFKRQLQ